MRPFPGNHGRFTEASLCSCARIPVVTSTVISEPLECYDASCQVRMISTNRVAQMTMLMMAPKTVAAMGLQGVARTLIANEQKAMTYYVEMKVQLMDSVV